MKYLKKGFVHHLGSSPKGMLKAVAAATLLAAAFVQPGHAQETNVPATPSPPKAAESRVTAMEMGVLPKSADVTISNEAMKGAAGNKSDWLLHGRTYDNQRFSELKQIDENNVNSLAPAALLQTGMTESFEATPIVVNGVMYLTTPIVDSRMKILAVNAATGARIWESSYKVGVQKLCCGPVNRGVAVGYGQVYFVTEDAELVALDARTGKQDWESNIADPRAGYAESMAPQIYDGMIIVGSSGGEYPIRGFVAAFDAKTGKQKWLFHTTDPKTFAGDSWKSGGGAVWTTPAIDTKRDLVIFSTGNPNPDLNGDSRKGDNLYTCSIVALHAKTGKLAWYYQESKHDLWDYDAVSNVVLFDAKDSQGKNVDAAGEAGKDGYFYIVNRDNGQLIRRSQPFVTINDNVGKAPTEKGVLFQPGPGGGAEWSPPAYSPITRDTYVLGVNQAFLLTKSAAVSVPGLKRWGSTLKPMNVAKSSGTLSAININTGKIDWQVKTSHALVSGALATAGNLVFIGENTGWFDAFNAKTGKKLWRFQLGAGVNAPAITYQVNGAQYIAVAAGGNFLQHSPRGDTLAIFKLPTQTASTH